MHYEGNGRFLEPALSMTNIPFPRTSVDINARVNGKHIELYRLFAIVGDRGGYDAVSSQKLEWRKVGQEFALGQTNSAAYAFALKTVYYKNLA